MLKRLGTLAHTTQWIIAIALVGAGVMPLAGCDGGEPAVEGEWQERVGESVQTHGEVNQAYPSGAFVLSVEGEWFGDEILVVRRQQDNTGPEIQEGAQVQVSGTVNEFLVADVEREVGFDLEQEIEVEWEDRAYILAESVTVMETE